MPSMILAAAALASLSASAPLSAAEPVSTTRINSVAPQYQTPVVAVVEAVPTGATENVVKHRYTLDLSLDSGINNYVDKGDFKGAVPSTQAYQLEFQPRLSFNVGDRLALGIHGLVGLEVPTWRKKTDMIAGAGVSAGVRFYPTATTMVQPTMDSSYVYHRTEDGLRNHGMRLTGRLDFFAKVCHHSHFVAGPYVKQMAVQKHDEARSTAYGMRFGYVSAF